MTSFLTRVVIVFLPRHLNIWLRFGKVVHERILDSQRRVVFLPAGSLFCRLYWRANDYGTIHWQLSLLQAAEPAQRITKIAGITPGAHLLVNARGEHNVQTVLQLIDRIEALSIDPTNTAAGYWRTVHNRIAAHQPPPIYSFDRHKAHIARVAFL